jgi:HNH endonuclease
MTATPSQAKNRIRRSLRNLVDPEIRAGDRMAVWRFFGNRCAYCRRTLDPAAREGHLDHLKPTAQGGSNHPSNRVLSCGACNGDHKREQSWQQFLKKRVHDAHIRGSRARRIRKWVQAAGVAQNEARLVKLADREAAKVIRAFEAACDKVRAAVKQAAAPSNKAPQGTAKTRPRLRARGPLASD